MTEPAQDQADQAERANALTLLSAPLNPRVTVPEAIFVQDVGVGGSITFLGQTMTTNDILTLLYGIENTILNNTGLTANNTMATNGHLANIETLLTTSNTLLNAILGQLVTLTTSVNTGNTTLTAINGNVSTLNTNLAPAAIGIGASVPYLLTEITAQLATIETNTNNTFNAANDTYFALALTTSSIAPTGGLLKHIPAAHTNTWL